jgi:hypothetical protein
MGFFDADPAHEPPPEQEYRPPEWSQPPENVMPAAVALDALVVRRDALAVWIADGLAYPTGLAFGIAVVLRHRPPPGRRPRGWFLGPGEPGGPLFGAGFADGRRTATDRALRSRDGGPPEIALGHRGGGGSDRQWHGRLWLWPLPPEGPLTFAFAWPEEGVEEVTVEVDSAPIRAAAARAVELWPEERPQPPDAGGGGWTSYA